MLLIVYYLIFMVVGDFAAYFLGRFVEYEWGSHVSLIVFLALYFLFLWVSWVLAVRAFGHGNNADILKLFFATKDLNITGKLEGRQEREVIGSLLAVDVRNPEDPKGEALGDVGDELTQERLNEMRHKGVKSVTVFAGYTTLDVREEEQPTTTRDRHNHVLAFDGGRPGDRRGAGRGGPRADRVAAEEADQGGRPQDRGAAARPAAPSRR